MYERIICMSKGVTRKWIWGLVWKGWGGGGGEGVGERMEGTIPVWERRMVRTQRSMKLSNSRLCPKR